MQEETTSAVETALDVGFLGGTGRFAVLLPLIFALGLPSSPCSSSAGHPNENAPTK